jgi:signal transduction histidine kinase
MSAVTILWCMSAAVALTVAACAALSWVVDRRNVAHLTFCLIAVATAAAIPLELGMMYATTAHEYGEALRWYHLPIFFVLVGHLLFIHYYLGTGRLWLLAAIASLRLFVLVANFIVDPNFNFSEIVSLQQLTLLGEEISVVGETVMRPWQWLAGASMLLLTLFVFDAAIRAYLSNGESRRKALLVFLGIGVPMSCNIVVNHLVAVGVLHVPVSASLWFLGTLTVVAYELSREFVASRRAQLQLAQLRGELAQIERVNSLGQLASALAHELKQPLTAALVNAATAESLAKKAKPDVEELRSVVTAIREDSQRAAAMIDRMRALIKGGTVDRQPIALDDLIQDVFALARPQAASRRVALECSMQSDLPPVLGDRLQISQVLLNLLINGIDAVADGSADARRVIVEGRTTSGRVEIAVLDSGPGIPADSIEQLFSSLYTTKSGGMGIGLALSRTIIEAHGGRLWAENDLRGGAAFRFILPVSDERAEEIGATSSESRQFDQARSVTSTAKARLAYAKGENANVSTASS